MSPKCSLYSPVGEGLSCLPLVRDYEEAFQTATGIAVRLIPGSPPPQRVSLGPKETEFCRRIAETPGGCAACRTVQAQLLRRMRRTRSPQQVCCFAGLTDVAVPVLVAGEHVATLLGGHVFAGRQSEKSFPRIAPHLKRFGLTATLPKLRRAYSQVPVMTKEQLRGLIHLLRVFAGHLGEFMERRSPTRANRLPLAVAQAEDYMLAHPEEHLRTRDIARLVHLNESYFCRLFKRATGITFTEHRLRVRVEIAKKMLRQNHQRIGEVACAAGFQSISDFNRVFRDRVGLTPSRYRTVHAPPI